LSSLCRQLITIYAQQHYLQQSKHNLCENVHRYERLAVRNALKDK